jgi:hypothetical protein
VGLVEDEDERVALAAIGAAAAWRVGPDAQGGLDEERVPGWVSFYLVDDAEAVGGDERDGKRGGRGLAFEPFRYIR